MQKNALRSLPRRLRYGLLRRRASFKLADLSGVTVELAHSLEGYVDAFRLIHDAYVARGWITPQPSHLWLTEHHMLDESYVFLLKKDGMHVGAVTLVLDSSAGLPIERTFALLPLRASGARIAEVGTLALRADFRGSGLALVLMCAMWRYAFFSLGVTDLVAAVGREVTEYYEALFAFRPFASPCTYEGFPRHARRKGEDVVAGLVQKTHELGPFLREATPIPRHGRMNPRTYFDLPFPAPFEQFERPTASDLARYKLPRDVFQELFARQTRLATEMSASTRDLLQKQRSRETLLSFFDLTLPV